MKKIPKQSTKKFLENAIASKSENRDVLKLIYKDNDYAVSTNGFLLHLTTEENSYSLGLNKTKNNGVLEGKYPNYKGIMQSLDQNSLQLYINPTELVHALKKALVFSDSLVRVTVEVFGESYFLNVKGSSAKRGESSTLVEFDLWKVFGNIEEFELQVDGRALARSILGLCGNESIFCSLSPVNPNLFEGKNRKVVIMPMSS